MMRSVSVANRQKQEKGQRNLAQAGRRISASDYAAAPVAYLECLFRQCIGSDHGIFRGIAGA